MYEGSTEMLTLSQRSLRVAGSLLLLALVALTFAAEGSQPFHRHESSSAGLYNTDCPLAELAAFNPASPVPPPSPSPGLALVTGAPPATPTDRPRLSPAPSSGSRAPPAPLA